MPEAIEKVVTFITRETKDGLELLFFKHPYAFNQLIAGTVDEGETPDEAVLRDGDEVQIGKFRMVFHPSKRGFGAGTGW